MLRITNLYSSTDTYGSVEINSKKNNLWLSTELLIDVFDDETNRQYTFNLDGFNRVRKDKKVFGVLSISADRTLLIKCTDLEYKFLDYVKEVRKIDKIEDKNFTLPNIRLFESGAFIYCSLLNRHWSLFDACYTDLVSGNYKLGCYIHNSTKKVSYEVVFEPNVDVFVTKLKVLKC